MLLNFPLAWIRREPRSMDAAAPLSSWFAEQIMWPKRMDDPATRSPELLPWADQKIGTAFLLFPWQDQLLRT